MSRLARALLITLLSTTAATVAHAQRFVAEMADTSSSVGSWSSFDLGPIGIPYGASGNPHFSYYDGTPDDLVYARKSGGVWIIETADGFANDVGRSIALAVDQEPGNPHVLYYDFTNGNLKYARKFGGAWIIEIADGSANDVGFSPSVVLEDTGGDPSVSYYDGTTRDLKYARRSGGAWTIETADGSANDVGSFTSIALDGSGNLHVSYYDATVGNLKYARRSLGAWTPETADGSLNNVGRSNSLAIDSAGNPHISYIDITLGHIKYARKSGGAWIREIVDEFGGDYISIELDSDGNPHVTYARGAVLKYAWKSTGEWTRETLVEGSAGITETHLSLDVMGNPHVGYSSGLLGVGYVYIPGALITSPQPAVTWAVGSQQTIGWAFTGGLPIGTSDVYLSVDGGNSFTQIRNEARDPEMTLRVPHSPTRFASIKVIRPFPYTEAYMDSFFTIDATIALAKFEAMRTETGTRVTWETRPGPEADIRYRVERGKDGAAFVSIADGLDRGEFIDPSAAATSRYRLIAINGLGEEYVLGETNVTAVLSVDRDIIAYPNPASGAIAILYRVPFDREIDLVVYDAAGRRVRSLVAGRQTVGVQSISWDRRDEAGRDVAAGTYFARLTSGAAFKATERITVVR